MKRIVTLIIILSLAVKVFLLFVVNKQLPMSTDEFSNYTIANNHQEGRGYTLYNIYKKQPVKTAFHNSFTVLNYELLIQYDIDIITWFYACYVLSMILFALSVYYFYDLSVLLIPNTTYALCATITYCFYPSVLYYIGTIAFYENIALPLSIIVLFKLIHALKNGFVKADYVVIPLSIAVSCLYRPQTIIVYALMLGLYGFIVLLNRSYRLLPLLFLSIIVTSLVHIPVLLKNKQLFDAYILSTQAGFEFLQGHNPTARGSWRGGWEEASNPLYIYSHSHIKNLDALDELQESKARLHLGISWIKEHPIEELKLDVRKIAIYFLPFNFEVLPGFNKINPINVLVHMLFMCAIIQHIYKRNVSKTEWMLLSPIAGSLFLSVIFFAGYRWRYYAEPFMIIFAWQFVFLFIHYIKKKRALNE